MKVKMCIRDRFEGLRLTLPVIIVGAAEHPSKSIADLRNNTAALNTRHFVFIQSHKICRHLNLVVCHKATLL